MIDGAVSKDWFLFSEGKRTPGIKGCFYVVQENCNHLEFSAGVSNMQVSISDLIDAIAD